MLAKEKVIYFKFLKYSKGTIGQAAVEEIRRIGSVAYKHVDPHVQWQESQRICQRVQEYY